MRRIPRLVVLASLIAFAGALAGCSNFDPDQLDFLHLSDKKKLPGKREPLFPNGVPGVSQGIPPEYMKGYQQQQAQQEQQIDATLGQTQLTPAKGATNAAKPAPQRTAAATPVEIKPNLRPKPKPKPRVHARRKVKPKPKRKAAEKRAKPQPASAPQPQKQQLLPWPGKQPQQGNTAPWPSSPPPDSNSPWPAAPPSGTFSK